LAVAVCCPFQIEACQMRIIRSSALALMLSAASGAMMCAPAQAQISINVRVNIAPPPLPYYEQPVIPAAGYLWVPGFWAWDETAGDYYWVPGTWIEPPQPGLLWTPAYWGWLDGRYVFYPGYWAPEVGFYGGINYGYGYTGDGYLGGRWDHGAFFYNRSVNNVESVRITNVYSQTVVVNNRSTNVSFNGGNGGTTVRPTPQQQAMAKQRHVAATPTQRQQVQTASKDKALFSKQNHGEPAIAATPRAGQFQGAGVSRGSRAPVAAKPNNEPAPNTERPGPGVAPPSKGVEPPKSAQQPPAAQPKADQKEAPKAEERRPSQEAPKAEEKRPPAQAPKAEEPRTPEPRAQEPKPVEPPKAEEPRRPMQEPPRQEPPRQEPPRSEQQRPPAQAPQPAMRPAPMPQRPAAAPAPAGRPPAEEKKRE
jgi:hypothetical protein